MTLMRPIILLAPWLVSATSLAATQERHYSCAEATRLVLAPEIPDSQARWAVSEIVGCTDGPAAMAARWRTASDLRYLQTWNYLIRDQRIAEAVMDVARDASRPTDLRLAAMETLISYFDSSATIRLENLRNPPPFLSLAHVSHPTIRVGTQPPASDLPERVYALSRELTADRNPTVARAAKAVWQVLTDFRPTLAEVPEGTVTVENICGTKFRITNGNDVDLTFELEIGSGYPPSGRRIPAHATREINVAAKDAVHLRYAGRAIASATVGAPCRP